jgi:hypothetical protein
MLIDNLKPLTYIINTAESKYTGCYHQLSKLIICNNCDILYFDFSLDDFNSIRTVLDIRQKYEKVSDKIKTEIDNAILNILEVKLNLNINCSLSSFTAAIAGIILSQYEENTIFVFNSLSVLLKWSWQHKKFGELLAKYADMSIMRNSNNWFIYEEHRSYFDPFIFQGIVSYSKSNNSKLFKNIRILRSN